MGRRLVGAHWGLCRHCRPDIPYHADMHSKLTFKTEKNIALFYRSTKQEMTKSYYGRKGNSQEDDCVVIRSGVEPIEDKMQQRR